MIDKKSKIILVVEDEKPIARALQLKFTKEGFEAIIAYNGKEALEIIEDKKVDLILLDLVMPVMDGFSMLKEMGSRNIKIPVIVTSNLGQEEDIKRAKTFGINDYFVKADTSLAEIVASVSKQLKK